MQSYLMNNKTRQKEKIKKDWDEGMKENDVNIIYNPKQEKKIDMAFIFCGECKQEAPVIKGEYKIIHDKECSIAPQQRGGKGGVPSSPSPEPTIVYEFPQQEKKCRQCVPGQPIEPGDIFPICEKHAPQQNNEGCNHLFGKGTCEFCESILHPPANEVEYICPNCGTSYIRETPCGKKICRNLDPIPIAVPPANEEIIQEGLEKLYANEVEDWDLENMLDNGYELCHTNGGQIFPRAGWYLQKADESGKVEDILYLNGLISKLIAQKCKCDD